MSEQTKKLFHLGGMSLSRLHELLQDYEYLHLENNDTLKQNLDEYQLMNHQEVNNSTDLFLLSKEMMPYLEQIDLISLPSHQIFYETLAGANEEEIKILNLKGAQAIDLNDGGENFAQFINQNYVKPWGPALIIAELKSIQILKEQ
ncbi:hypothetical protein P9166_12530 [Lactococcus lactis]|nr:hypothetical protein P9166_12530 [Lactococcus lactis]